MVALGPHAQPHPFFCAKQTAQPGAEVPHWSPNPKRSCLSIFIYLTGRSPWMIMNSGATLGTTHTSYGNVKLSQLCVISGDNE